MLHQLSSELLFSIMDYLDPVSLCRLARTSKQLKNLAYQNLLWKRIAAKHGVFKKPENLDWRKFFIQIYDCKCVVLLNDDKTEMGSVVVRLQNSLKISVDKSVAYMLAAHALGSSIVYWGPTKEARKIQKKMQKNNNIGVNLTKHVNPYSVLIDRNDWLTVAKVRNWNIFTQACQDLGVWEKVAKFPYISYSATKFIVFQGSHRECKFLADKLNSMEFLEKKPFIIEEIAQHYETDEKLPENKILSQVYRNQFNIPKDEEYVDLPPLDVD